MIIPRPEDLRDICLFDQGIGSFYRLDTDIDIDFLFHHILCHLQKMSRLETADRNRQVRMHAKIRHARIAVQSAVDIHGYHICAAVIDLFDDATDTSPDGAMKTGAKDTVSDGAKPL